MAIKKNAAGERLYGLVGTTKTQGKVRVHVANCHISTYKCQLKIQNRTKIKLVVLPKDMIRKEAAAYLLNTSLLDMEFDAKEREALKEISETGKLTRIHGYSWVNPGLVKKAA